MDLRIGRLTAVENDSNSPSGRDIPVIGVTGATGLLGSAWVRYVLANDGFARVVALVRNPEIAAQSSGFAGLPPQHLRRVEFVRADFGDLRLSSAELRCMARVNTAWWHFAAVTNLGRDEATAQAAMAVNARGARRLLTALRQVGSTVPFFHASTAYVVRPRAAPAAEIPCSRHGPFRNAYEQSKAIAEAHVREYFADGRTGAIFRPSVVIATDEAAGGAQWPDLCARAVIAAVRRQEREFVFRFPESARLNVVSLDWVIRALAKLGQVNGHAPEIYHLTSEHDLEFASLGREIERHAAGLRVRFSPRCGDAELAPASMFFNRLFEDVREYVETPVTFDRFNAVRRLPAEMIQESLDVAALVRNRLAPLRGE